jgi:hypothetical protein
MQHDATDIRLLFSSCASGIIGTATLVLWPFPVGDVLLQIIRIHDHQLFVLCAWTYAALAFTTPFLLTSLGVLDRLHLSGVQQAEGYQRHLAALPVTGRTRTAIRDPR